MAADLTPKEARFVEEYLIDLNGAQAVIRAGYSAKTARSAAAEIMGRPRVAAAIEAAKASRMARTEVTQDRVLQELAAMAFYDAGELGSHKITGPSDIIKLPEPLRRCIVGWAWDRSGNFTLKLADKLAAAGRLGQHLGMFKDRVEHTGASGGPIVIAASPLDERL